MTNIDSVLKSRDIILPTVVHIVKAMVLQWSWYSCENWTTNESTRELMPLNCGAGEDS